jgi:hypothetical protein
MNPSLEHNEGDTMDIVAKANQNWYNSIKSSWLDSKIRYANYWTVGNSKPAKIKEGDKIYLYIDAAINGKAKLVGEGTFREYIYRSDIFPSDVLRKMTVKQAFLLYHLGNGASTFVEFVNLLKDNYPDCEIESESKIGCTLISDLVIYNEEKYYYYINDGHMSMSAQGYVYIRRHNNIIP